MKRLCMSLTVLLAMLVGTSGAFAAKLIKPATAARLIRADVKQQSPTVKRWAITLDRGSLKGTKWFTATQIMPKGSLLTVMPMEVRGVINLDKAFRGARISYPKRVFR